MKKTFASLTEDSRDSLLNVVADAVSHLHRNKSKLEDECDDDDDAGAKQQQSGDFVYDFTRLNLQYLNQLASLGSNYSSLGARALEKIHEYWLGPPKHDAAAELTVTSKVDTHCTLRIENPFAQRAKVSVSQPKLKSTSLASGEKTPSIKVETVPAKALFVGVGKTVTLEVTASANGARVGRAYDFELPVEFTSGPRTSRETLKLKVRRVRS